MMPSIFPVVLALSWALMSALPTVQGAISPGGGVPLADLPVPINAPHQPYRMVVESLGFGEIDLPVSLRSFTLDLLAAEPQPWPEAQEAADKTTTAHKQAPPPMSIAMWFGVLGATLLILPRLRRR